MSRKSETPLESEEQQRLFEWANLMSGRYPELDRLVAIPNGGLRNKPVAVRLKAEGVRRGFPDMILPVARQGYHSLAIELKRIRGGKVSDEQDAWLRFLAAQGWKAFVCFGADDAITELQKYLGIEGGSHENTRTETRQA